MAVDGSIKYLGIRFDTNGRSVDVWQWHHRRKSGEVEEGAF